MKIFGRFLARSTRTIQHSPVVLPDFDSLYADIYADISANAAGIREELIAPCLEDFYACTEAPEFAARALAFFDRMSGRTVTDEEITAYMLALFRMEPEMLPAAS